MPRRLVTPSLRRSLIASVLVVVLTGTLAMVGALSSTFAIRRAIDRDASALLAEQRIADEIIALTYQQQLEAYRYVQAPDTSSRLAFQRLGDDADARMRQYLFHELSPDARLQVEVMKETHASFEAAAQHALELAERGEVDSARARLAALKPRTTALDGTVARFLGARSAQRAVLLRDYDAVSARLRVALIGIGIGLLVLSLWLGHRLRRLVVVPLDQLTAVARRISAGDSLARVPAQRFAELQEVGIAFNTMADSVQLSRETAEMQNEELRQSLDQLQSTQDELVQHEKLSAMGQMLAGLAHELNNPLGGVLGMAQLLRSDLQSSPHPEVRRIDVELGAPIEREAVRARDLVRTLLNFARKPTGDIEPVSVTAAVATATGLRTHAFAMAGRSLSASIPPGLLVMADVQTLQHAIVNVVNNALDAMASGGGSSLVISAATDDEGMVSLHFDDDGPGFANARAAFDPFYTTKPAGEGTGLGLTLVERFINESGGSVAASNRAGSGARVTLTLRAAPVEAGVVRAPRVTPPSVPASSPAHIPARAVPPLPKAGRRPLALVVDDEPALREVQRRLLMLEGLDVVLAESGEQAQALLAREPVDLVISDLRMPGNTDGRTLLAALARDYPHLSESVLVVTGDVSGLPAANLPVPPERVLGKPFTRTEYIQRIRTILSRQHGAEPSGDRAD